MFCSNTVPYLVCSSRDIQDHFLKAFIMKPSYRKLSVIAFIAALFPGCTETGQEKNETKATAEHHHVVDTVAGNNEVKSVAPDAEIRTEQGYAFPRNTPNLAQSPIDIITDKTDKEGSDQISFAFHCDIDTAENQGHTIELEFKEGSKCTVNGKDYASKQFHFHTPSEHLIDGATYPMEMHIVNVLQDSAGQDAYVVIGVLFKMGTENKFLKEFLSKIPAREGEKTVIHPGEVKLDDLVAQFTKNELRSYYTYKGSLTTPPFTESVRWIIVKHVLEASEEQIMMLEKMEGNNARHVQAVNDRVVYSR